MNPGSANILVCPHCGGEKKVMSLISSNTYGGTPWSDTKTDYPMLPRVSATQQCNEYKKFFFLNGCEQHVSQEEHDWSFEFGKFDKWLEILTTVNAPNDFMQSIVDRICQQKLEMQRLSKSNLKL